MIISLASCGTKADKVGNYMMSFTVAAYTQAEMDNIISCISEI